MSIFDNNILYYLSPTNSPISTHDYNFLSTVQQKQCKPIYKAASPTPLGEGIVPLDEDEKLDKYLSENPAEVELMNLSPSANPQQQAGISEAVELSPPSGQWRGVAKDDTIAFATWILENGYRPHVHPVESYYTKSGNVYYIRKLYEIFLKEKSAALKEASNSNPK